MLNHSNWLIFVRSLSSNNDSLKVVIYINIRLLFFWFLLCKDLLNHRNISLVSFFNNSIIFFLINVYSNFSQSTLKYLKDTKANIYNVLVITRDFNIKDNLSISTPTNWVLTRYSDNNQDTNLELDLVFLQFVSNKLDNHSIYLD